MQSVRASWPALALLTVVYAVNFIDRQILSMLIVPIERELGVSDSAMGFLTGTAFALFYTLAGIPIARWSDRGVRRDIIALGLAVWSGMTALSGLAGTFLHLALLRVGVGVGEASLSPAAHSMIADLFPRERRGTALAIYACGINAGILLAFMLGGWIEEVFGWRKALMIVGAPGIVLAVVVRATLREPARGASDAASHAERRASFGMSVRELWRICAYRHMCLGAGLASFVGYAFLTWNPTFLARVHGMESGAIGTCLGLTSGLGGAAGTLAGGFLADRLARRDERWRLWLPAAGLLAALPCFMAFALAPQPFTALAFLVPAQVGAALWLGPVFGLAQTLSPLSTRALASSVLIFVVNVIGLALGPQVVGFLNDALASRFGSSAIQISLASICVVELWAALHFLRAARSLGDGQKAPSPFPGDAAQR